MEEASFFQLPPSLQPFGHQTNVFEDRSWQGSGKALVKHGTLLQHDLEDLYGKSRGDEEEVQEKHTNSYLESNERVMRKVLRGEGNMADIENTEKYLDSSYVHKVSPKLTFTFSSSNTKKQDTSLRFAPIHLVTMFKDETQLFEIILDNMRKDKAFAEGVLLSKVETKEDHDEKHSYDLPDIVFGPTTLHLAVKYNKEALTTLLQVARSHNLLEKVFKATDSRGINLLQFATFNVTPECLKILMAEAKHDGHRLLSQSRNNSGESPLQT